MRGAAWRGAARRPAPRRPAGRPRERNICLSMLFPKHLNNTSIGNALRASPPPGPAPHGIPSAREMRCPDVYSV